VKGEKTMNNHKTGTREEWLAARLELLKAEKEMTRRSDELARRRQELPWVRIDKDYRFETDEGKASRLFVNRAEQQKLFVLGIHGRGHAADDLPCAVSANPGVGGAKNFCVRFGRAGASPHYLYPVMNDRNISDDLNGQLLDRERLQLDPFGHVRGDPVGDLIFSNGR